jgi:hypothetical protein
MYSRYDVNDVDLALSIFSSMLLMSNVGHGMLSDQAVCASHKGEAPELYIPG